MRLPLALLMLVSCWPVAAVAETPPWPDLTYEGKGVYLRDGEAVPWGYARPYLLAYPHSRALTQQADGLYGGAWAAIGAGVGLLMAGVVHQGSASQQCGRPGYNQVVCEVVTAQESALFLLAAPVVGVGLGLPFTFGSMTKRKKALAEY